MYLAPIVWRLRDLEREGIVEGQSTQADVNSLEQLLA